MIALAMKITFVLALATLLDIALRRRGSAFARHLTWTMAVCVLLALPIGSLVLPEWRVLPSDIVSRNIESVESNLPPIADGRQSEAQPETLSGLTRAAPPTTDQPAVSSQPARGTSIWIAFALFAYAGIALALLLRIAAEHLLVARLARRGAPLRSDDWSALVQSVRAHLGVRRAVDVRAVSGSVMPLACGILRSRVLLPAAAEDWPADRRRAVLLHEMAHVARHDCLTQTLAAVACALYWPHPGVWWAAHRLRVEREHACDALALAGGVPRIEYATHLLEIARAYGAPRFAAGAVPMARSRIEVRLHAVLAMHKPERPLSRHAAVATVMATFALLIPLAAMAPAAGAATAKTPSGDASVSAAPEQPADGALTSEPAAAGDSGDPLSQSAGDDVAPTMDAQPAATALTPPSTEDAQPLAAREGQSVAPPAPSSQSATPITGRWIVSSLPDGGQQLELFWDDGTRWRRRLDPAESAAVSGNRGGTWLIERDAGRLELTQRGMSPSPAGLLVFVPNRAFGETLKELGLTRPGGEVTDEDLKVLAWGNVGESTVRRLRAQFDTLAYGDLIAFATRAASPE